MYISILSSDHQTQTLCLLACFNKCSQHFHTQDEYESCNMALTFEAVDENVWCDHSIDTSLAVLSHGTICFSAFYDMKFGSFGEF